MEEELRGVVPSVDALMGWTETAVGKAASKGKGSLSGASQ